MRSLKGKRDHNCAFVCASTFIGSNASIRRLDQRSVARSQRAQNSFACGNKRRVSIVCSEYGQGAEGTGVVDKTDGKNALHIVFVHPQIHWNTGNIGRTCLGLGASLHLVGPLGFSVDEKQVRRAGLDYWQHVDVNVYKDWNEFANGRMQDLGGTRYFYTKFGAECATNVQWPSTGKIVMIFGSEVDGFNGIGEWLDTQGKNERRVAFPMVDERFRSFNLSTTASMVRYDAVFSIAIENV